MDSHTKESEIFAMWSFSGLGLNSTLSDQLREKFGFEFPTLIHAQAIPVILSGRHLFVNAETGFSKAIAYLAPIIHHLQGYNPRITHHSGTFALVLVPTHELCLQLYAIVQEILTHCNYHWIVPGYLMGGENMNKAKARLQRGISILIATPGPLLDHLKGASFKHSSLRWIIFDEADRILELGFGKDIEKILDILGSQSNESVGKGKSSECQRQNLLLSAVLNEKVNHLAKISLENPIMIGFDSMDMQQDSSVNQIGSLGPNVDRELDYSSKFVSPSIGDNMLPAQLVQDISGRLDDLVHEFNNQKKAEKRPASVPSPSYSPAKKGKVSVYEGEPAFVASGYQKVAIPAQGINITAGPTTKSFVGAKRVKEIDYDSVVQCWPTSKVESLRETRSIDTLKSGVALLAQVMSANLAAIASMEEEMLLADGTKQAMEVVSKEKEELQTKLSVAEQELRIAKYKARLTSIVNQRLECQLEETMVRSREGTKKMNQEIATVQVELEGERKEKQELQALLHREQLWREELLEHIDHQGSFYRECALFEVQLKYGPLNLTGIPFDDLRSAPEGFNVCNPTAEVLGQQRNRGGQ